MRFRLIWAASYRLYQTIKYWSKGTTFVSVVDPGVGSNRKSIAAKTKSGHFIITPDNGSLTHVATYMGLDEVREIDEQKNRLPYSSESNTFHGRDIYAYNGALLAEGEKSFEDLGETLDPTSVVKLPLTEASLENDHLRGSIDVLDIRFGSLWTNIPYDLIKKGIFNAVINLLLLLLIKTKFIIMIQYLLSGLLPMYQSMIL